MTQTDGKLQPLCAAYRTKNCLPKLEEFLRRESSNAVKDFLEIVPTRVVEAKLLAANGNLFSTSTARRIFERCNFAFLLIPIGRVKNSLFIDSLISVRSEKVALRLY